MPKGHHRSGDGIVRDKNGGEILIARPRPMERTRNRSASADFLDRETLDVSVELIVDPRRRVERRRALITEARRPGGERGYIAALIDDAGFKPGYVGVVERESLADCEVLIGVFERDAIAVPSCNVKR